MSINRQWLILFLIGVLSLVTIYPINSSLAKSSSIADPYENIVTVYIPTEDGLVEIGKEGYINLMNKLERNQKLITDQKNNLMKSKVDTGETTNQDIVPLGSFHNTYRYDEMAYLTESTLVNKTRRISPYVVNNTSSTITRDIEYQTTQSYSANRSITIQAEKDALSAGITIGSSWSQSFAISDKVSSPIKPGYRNWMDYTPIVDNSFGWMTIKEFWVNPPSPPIETDSREVFYDIYIAREISNRPDGLYIVKEERVP